MPGFTENGHYVVDSGKLYLRQSHGAGALNHTRDLIDVKTFTPPNSKADTYVCLKSTTKYFLDCLITAEDLVTNAFPNDLDDTGVIRTCTAATNEDFGTGHDENRDIAKLLRKQHANEVDRNAAPAVGQAYVIVSLYKNSKYPYHAAAVIAADGNSRVTLEVFASGEDADSRTVDGGYEIYSVLPNSGDTFHDRWFRGSVFRHGTGATPPVTLVIKKK